jgi:hypothetical protein
MEGVAMAWRAYVDSIRDNPVPDDTVWVAIRFVDEERGGKQMTKEYKFTSGTTTQEVRDLIVADRQKLEDFEAVKAQLVQFVGIEVT